MFKSLTTTNMSPSERLPNIHPGEVLNEEFLKPLGLTPYRLAKDTFLPQTRISEILKGKRRITADTALRFAAYFGSTADFWLGLQNDYDLEEERRLIGEGLSRIVPYSERWMDVTEDFMSEGREQPAMQVREGLMNE